jgi:hypothetical protein
MQIVEKTFRNLAHSIGRKDYYLKNNQGLDQIWRVNEIGLTKCYWGMFYVKNDGNKGIT